MAPKILNMTYDMSKLSNVDISQKGKLSSNEVSKPSINVLSNDYILSPVYS